MAGDVLSVLTNFLTDKKRRVVLNHQHSSWADIKAGVPQGSIVGHIFFLLCINYLTENLDPNPKFFAHDTFLFSLLNNAA